MGAGGLSGAVSFPLFISDLHGYLMASTGVDDTGAFSLDTWTKPEHDVVELINDAWANNPYDGFAFTDPEFELEESKDQFDLYYGAVTSLAISSYSSYISKALLAVTNPTTGQLPDLSVSLATSAPSTPQTLFTNFATTTRAEIAKFLSDAQGDIQSDVEALLGSASSTALAETTLTAATTVWRTFISAATAELKKCDFPKEVNALQVINEASSNASSNLKAALRLVKDLVSGSIVQEVVDSFEDRREITYQRQVSDFAGTMADLNAVSSSSFMFGIALLRAEQMREVAEFDSQISLGLLERGLSTYVQVHANQLRVSAEAALANSRAHNELLNASIQLLAILKRREEITPTDLMSLYSGLFQAEIASYTNLGQAAFGTQADLYRRNIDRDRLNHSLNLEADQLNKAAKERRYLTGLGQVLQILTNRTEFERAAAALLTEQNRVKITARSQFEGLEIEDLEREALWQLDVAKAGVGILAAPHGMAAAIPKLPHPALQIAGTALQAAGTGAAVFAKTQTGGAG